MKRNNAANLAKTPPVVEREFYGKLDKFFEQKSNLDEIKTENDKIRREKLMPFFWNTIVNQGQLYGNVTKGSEAKLKNPYLFSYPGYSEMLVGYVDLTRNSNNKENNHLKMYL